MLPVKKHRRVIFFGPPMMLAMVYVMVGVGGDPSWAKGFTTESRGGLALLNVAVLWPAAIILGNWPFMVRLYFDLHGSRGGEDERRIFL
jgi:hypothetical protein